jgi:hypothetical protein
MIRKTGIVVAMRRFLELAGEGIAGRGLVFAACMTAYFVVLLLVLALAGALP